MRHKVKNITIVNEETSEKREIHIDGVTAKIQNKDGEVAYIEDVEGKLDKPTTEADNTHTNIVVVNEDGESALKPLSEIGSNGEVPLTDTFIVNKPAGNFNMGDNFPAGLTLAQAFKKLLTGVYDPTFVNPTFSLTSDKLNITQEVGSTISVKLTATYNPGRINGAIQNSVWVPTAVQNNRGGSVITYVIDGETQTSNILTKTKTFTTKGSVNISASVEFGDGPQPLNSDGEIFDSPYTGRIINASTTLKSDYKRFYGPDDSIPTNPRNLSSVFDDTSVSWSFNTGVLKRFFHIYIPANRTLSSVVDSTALGAVITSQYIQQGTTVVVKDAAGNDVNYKHYKMTIDEPYVANHVHQITIS